MLKSGNCLVNLARFISDSGGATLESPIPFLLQDYINENTPSPSTTTTASPSITSNTTSASSINTTTVTSTTSNPTEIQLQQLVNQLIEQLRSLLNQLVSKGGVVPQGLEQYLTSASKQSNKVSDITRDLHFGLRGTDVILLQNFLIDKNSGPNSLKLKQYGATGYFGSVTKSALAEYQKFVGIAPAVGYFGSITRNYLKSIGY